LNHFFFSIVVPTYNRANLITETLKTVFDQTYKNYEVIVVDNHSTDNTLELLRPLVIANKIKYIRNEKNFERARSRNIGMQVATGDFLTFLDSDDFMYPDCLSDANEFASNNPDCRIFQNLFETVDNNRQLVYKHHFPSLENQYWALANGNFISCIGGFIHREIYTKIQFAEDPKLIASEDYEIWFKILAEYKMGRVDKVNSGIREHVNRSVNLGAYDNLAYQKEYIISKIKTDSLLNEKFGKYVNRIATTFTLQQIVSSYKTKNKFFLVKELMKTVLNDINILTESRFYKVAYNILKA
jgi:glycosyltransferase involved in cell wall biosynthesis